MNQVSYKRLEFLTDERIAALYPSIVNRWSHQTIYGIVKPHQMGEVFYLHYTDGRKSKMMPLTRGVTVIDSMGNEFFLR